MAKARTNTRRKALVEQAPAKINLTLSVLGRRGDGYHTLESLVAFARAGDRLALVPGKALALKVRGPTAAATGGLSDNLVLKAAGALQREVRGLTLGRFILTKNLPVAGGLGGGSADAAAALRLLARANRISLKDPRLMKAARRIGADVPVCLDPRPRVMRGIGERLSEPVKLPRMAAVLVNPDVALATSDVFAAWDRTPTRSGKRRLRVPRDADALMTLLEDRPNDLEGAAVTIAPVITDVLASVNALPGCRLARMSGSGATCFGLFASQEAATKGARRLAAANPGWWVHATVLG